MDRQNHQLPDFLLADLYRHSIVLVEEEYKLGTTTIAVEKPPVEKPIVAEPIATPVTTTPVAKEKKAPAPVAPPPAGDWYLGNNQKNIAIVVDESEAKYLNDDSLQFLSSILGACKLNLGDVAIINFGNTPVSYASIKEKLTPANLLFFDITAKQVQLSFAVPFYQVQKYDNCQFLFAPSLEKMLGTGQDAKLEKSKLWLCLKKMFDIK